jgi:hypothetical protein
MCAERVSSLQKILQHTERQSATVLGKNEKIFPAVNESLVSVVCLNAQEALLCDFPYIYRHRRKATLSMGFINDVP